MNLRAFEVGLEHPIFLIAGARWSAGQGPRGTRGCDRGDAQRGRGEGNIV